MQRLFFCLLRIESFCSFHARTLVQHGPVRSSDGAKYLEGEETEGVESLPGPGKRALISRGIQTGAPKKGYGGTGIRARVERITTANANHYTIPPRLCLNAEQPPCGQEGGGQEERLLA